MVPRLLPRSDPASGVTDRRTQVFHLAAMTVVGLTFALWIGCVVYVPEAINRDWVAFDDAADRLAAAPHAADVYRDSMREEWPFLYPPYVLPLVAPLAAIGPMASYLLAAGLGLVAVGCSLRLFRTTRPYSSGEADALRAGVLGCGVVLANTITGQFAPLYLLAVVGAWWAWSRGHRARAGAALGILLLKPYLAVPFLGYLALRRDRRALGGFALVALGALAVGLAFGSDAWAAYADSLAYMATKERIGLTPTDKQVTVVSAVRVLLLGGGTATWVEVLWLAVAASTGAVVLAALTSGRPWRLVPTRSTPTLRTVGLVALFAVVASPRLYFYDALLAVPAAVAWYLHRYDYASPRRHRLIGGCIAAAVAAYQTIFTPFPMTYLAGVAMAGWLVIEALDQRAGNRTAEAAAEVRRAAEAGERAPAPS